MIVAAGVLMLIQGIAQVLRCIICIRTGEWIVAAEDIEETEVQLAKQQGVARAFRVFDGARGWTRPQRRIQRRAGALSHVRSDHRVHAGIFLFIILLGFRSRSR